MGPPNGEMVVTSFAFKVSLKFIPETSECHSGYVLDAYHLWQWRGPRDCDFAHDVSDGYVDRLAKLDIRLSTCH